MAVLTAAAEPAGRPLEFEFALYFSPKPAADPAKELARLLEDRSRRLLPAGAKDLADSVASVRGKWVPLSDYAPPTAESLRYTGVGVAVDEAAKLAAAERAFVVVFTTSKRQALPANLAACVLVHELARATGSVIWDDETRQVFSVAKWQERRIDTWQGGLADVTAHVTMHAYANPELIRVITLGLRKFGQPDLVIQDLPNQLTRPAGNCINAVMQRLVEGPKPEDGRLRLVLGEIRHAEVRKRSLEQPGPGAEGAVLISLQKAPLEDGDPRNDLWRVGFPEAKGKEVAERVNWAMAHLFGSTDRISQASAGDPELEAARARARKAFFAQEAKFRGGLPFNEHLLVKAPFVENGQTEYMWVEVVRWGPRHVEGVLSSDPYYVKSLRAGASVKVPFDEVYDYLLYKADGTTEGNETGKVLERRDTGG